MTKDELIKKLSKYPDDTAVRVYVSAQDRYADIVKVAADKVFVYGQAPRHEVLLVVARDD